MAAPALQAAERAVASAKTRPTPSRTEIRCKRAAATATAIRDENYNIFFKTKAEIFSIIIIIIKLTAAEEVALAGGVEDGGFVLLVMI